jgi:hypothetical protein
MVSMAILGNFASQEHALAIDRQMVTLTRIWVLILGGVVWSASGVPDGSNIVTKMR